MSILKSKGFVNFIFWVFLLFGVISLFWSYLVHQNEIEIPILGHINADIRINIEADKKYFQDIHIFANKKELPPAIMSIADTYASYETNNVPIYSLEIKIDGDENEILHNIKDIVFFVSHKMVYFSGEEILKFEKSKSGNYIFPSSVYYSKNSKYITDRGNLRHFSYGFLSLFYNTNFYIIPIFWFIASLLTYLNNKDKILLRFNLFKNQAILWIIFLAFILRITDTIYPFWTDELYTSTVAGNPSLPIFAIFSDPGNPPLFFLIARYWQMIFGQNESLLRLLPCIFSVISIYILYLVIKKYVNKTAALLALFLFAINVYSIHSGMEYRVYSLAGLFSVLSFYFLFEIIKNKKTKDFIIYAILSILMVNSHYFQILVLMGNFFFAMIFLDNKTRLKFFGINCIGALSFLPFFIKTALNSAVLNSDFNKIPLPSLDDMVRYFDYFYGNIAVSLLVVVIFVYLIVLLFKNKFEDKKQTILIYIYSVYTVVFVFVSSYIISLVRPIIRPYYYINILPFVIISLALIYYLPFEKINLRKILSIFTLSIYFLFGSYLSKDVTILITFQPLIQYCFYDSIKYPDVEKIGITMHDKMDYMLFYKDFMRKNASVVMYKFAMPEDDFIRIIKNAPEKIIYSRLEFRTFPYVTRELSKIGDVALIRGDRDVIFARIVKK